MIRAVVIDDEHLARQRILKLLEEFDDIKVIGEARNGSQALEVIELNEPDLVFLDVQMPDFDGFEVVRKMQPKHSPYIVFATAYDSYAIQAFSVHALDYLLKPIDEDRFNASMQKVMEHFELKKSSQFNKKLMKMVKVMEQKTDEFITTISYTDRGIEYVVDLDEVLYLQASGNYISLITKSKSHLYRSTMNALSIQLNPEEFIRIHRSIIINKRFIRKCSYSGNNEYQFRMKDDTTLLSGRSYKTEIMRYLGEL